MKYKNIPLYKKLPAAAVENSVRAFAPQAKDLVLKRVVTAPLPIARQLVLMSRVLGDDHYKRMPRVIVGVTR